MKKVFINIMMCVACLAIGLFLGSYITKNRVQKELETTIHESIIQELDNFSDALLEAAVINYAGKAYNSKGKKFPPDTFYVQAAEQTAWFVSKFLGDLDAYRRLNGLDGEYLFYPIDCSMNLIRSESESVAEKFASSFPDNVSLYTKSPWNNDVQINKRLLPRKGGSSLPANQPNRIKDI